MKQKQLALPTVTFMSFKVETATHRLVYQLATRCFGTVLTIRPSSPVSFVIYKLSLIISYL